MTKTKDSLILLISDHLGVDKSDITEEDNFKDDLHMSASDLTDLAELIQDKWSIANIDFSKISTVGDLVDYIELEGEI